MTIPRPFPDFEALPTVARRTLAEGPVPDPFCGVCLALTEAEEWARSDDAKALVESDPEAWMRAEQARRSLQHWHDPGGQDSTFWRSLGRAVEHLGWNLSDAPQAGMTAREVFFETNGRGHKVLNDLAGELSWPRCLLLYVLAGWRPDASHAPVEARP